VPDREPYQQADGPRIPSKAQAFWVWLTSGLAMLVVGAGVWLLASLLMAYAGLDPGVLKDPERSPLFRSPLGLAIATAFSQGTLLVMLVLWLMRLRPSLPHVLPWHQPSLRHVLGGLLLVFGAAPAANALGLFVQKQSGAELTTAKILAATARHASIAELLLLLFALALLPAVVEEGLFRGLITAPFLKSSRVLAVLVPSLMFGLFHIEAAQAAGTFVLGLAFAGVRLGSGSLWPCVIGHGVYNGAVVASARYSDITDETGISLAAVLGGGAVAAVGLWLLFRRPAADTALPAR
jgi:membrane protease YdiL (CAAX protease family)